MAEKILATVGELTVTEAEVQEMIGALMQRGQNYNNPQGIDIIVEQLIGKKLLLMDARKNLYEYNEEFKKNLQKVKEEMLTNFALQKAIEKANVTDEEVKAYYDENKESFKKGESVQASHILVDTEEKANELLEKITKGEVSFEDAARDNSSCPSSQNGGSLGEFTKGQMVPEFDEAVFSMEVGEVKGPVKTQFGFHIIKLTGKTPESLMDFDEVKMSVKEMLMGQKQQQAYESKINQLKILYPVTKL